VPVTGKDDISGLVLFRKTARNSHDRRAALRTRAALSRRWRSAATASMRTRFMATKEAPIIGVKEALVANDGVQQTYFPHHAAPRAWPAADQPEVVAIEQRGGAKLKIATSSRNARQQGLIRATGSESGQTDRIRA
jgi:hypothetical protein